MRFVIIFVIIAVMLGYDFTYNDGQYFRFVLTEAISLWRSIESAVMGLF